MAPGKYLFFFFLSYLCLEFACCASLSSNDCGTLEKNNKKVYAICVDLQTINGTFEYDYNAENSSLTVLFTATPPNPKGWILWGINPNHTGLQGAQVIAAFKQNNAVVTRNFDLKSYLIPIPDKVSIEVWGARADEEYGRMKLFASIKLPVNKEAVNLVWQKGSSLTEDNILVQDASSKDNLEVKEGFRLIKSLSSSVNKWRTAHEGMSAVSWGIIRPIGLVVLISGPKIPLADRYWLRAYIFCQSTASAVGYLGFISGIILASTSKEVQFYGHLIVGVILVFLDVIQIAIVCRKPNVFHQSKIFWTIAGIITALTILNIYIGMEIANTADGWVVAYDVWGGISGLFFLIAIGSLMVGCIKKRKRYGPVDEPAISGMQPNS